MSRISIWQCKDDCRENKPYSLRYWFARSKDFDFYEMVSTFGTAIILADRHVRSHK